MYVCVVQEWASKYYKASTALKDKESMLDNVAEEIEKVGIIKFNGSSLECENGLQNFLLRTSTYWEPLPLKTSYSR